MVMIASARRIKPLLLSVFVTFACLSLTLARQVPLRFEHLSIREGLSQNTITCTLQDRQGFMWFGTADGLNRYDGYSFKIYRHQPGNPASLRYNDIAALLEDRQGNLWVGSNGGGLSRFDPVTETFTHYEQPGILSNRISVIRQDESGLLWLGTLGAGGGLLSFDPVRKVFRRYYHVHPHDTTLKSDYIRAIVPDGTSLWVATFSSGLLRLDKKTGRFEHYRHEPDNPNSLSENQILSLARDASGTLWLGNYSTGLTQVIPARTPGEAPVFIRHPLHQGNFGPLINNRINCLLATPDGNLWIGTKSGLAIRNGVTGEVSFYAAEAGLPHSLSNNRVTDIYRDRSGNCWVGTEGGGLNLVARSGPKFEHLMSDPGGKGLSSNLVTALLEDQRGNVWIGTLNGGLNHYNPQTRTFGHYRHDPVDDSSLSNNDVTALLEDAQGTLWVGTLGGGLNRLDPQQGTFRRYVDTVPGFDLTAENRIYRIFEDQNQQLWIATYSGGLKKFDRRTGQFTRYFPRPGRPFSLKSRSVTTIHGDRQGNLWLGTLFNGLSRFSPSEEKFIQFVLPSPAGNVGPLNVYSIVEKPDGIFWLGTNQGLLTFRLADVQYGVPSADQATIRKYRLLTEKEGLTNNVIYGILPDDKGNLWLSSNKGLSVYNPAARTFRHYDQYDGLQSNQFSEGAYCRGRSGRFYFGGIEGFNSFDPVWMPVNGQPPPVAITHLQVNNQEARVGSAPGGSDDQFYLPQSITLTRRLTLPYDRNILSFTFAALDYTTPLKNQYAYQLQGFDQDWIPAGNRRFATYTNLDPGEYTFRVKAANNDGVWNTQGTSIRITITPPWWRTWWAYLAYALLTAGALYAWWRYTINRERLKNDLKIKQLESEQLKELNRMKTRFFTNISHEFRTPLTLILGPLQQLLAQPGTDAEGNRRQYSLMQRQAQRLLQLINQLLDLAKLEEGREKLQAIRMDVGRYVQAIVYSFNSLAETQQVTLTFQATQESIVGYADRDKLEKIISNLLSNAFKFTPAGGEIRVHLSVGGTEPEPVLDIVVADTGIGIPADRLPRIFDRFYQVDGSPTREREGTGIGLALVRELVALHHGSIRVESEAGRGSRFTVTLPIGNAHLQAEEIVKVSGEAMPDKPFPATVPPAGGLPPESTVDAIEHEGESYAHLPLILVVEDNDEVRDYIRDNFDAGYRLAEARDGQQGLEKAIEVVPDLIISDWMMPGMDGVELCRRLKTDERTSHVPVILLTARASAGSRLEGLETGADDYLTKPFSPQELRIRVKNLIEGRKRMRERYSREVKLQPRDIAITSADERFLQRALAVVEQHLADPDFGVEAFESEIAMSKTQLYRKLKALTDQSPSEFIRNLRLKKAALLIRARSGSIAEITYEVGFNNLSYFSKCFREVYGVSPSEYARSTTPEL